MHARETSEPSLEQQAGAVRGRGRPLERDTQAALERSTGRLMGHVRVHDDALGQALAASSAARAVTVGGDIAIGSGGVGQPDVLAHELAHAAQLSGRPAHGPLALSTPGDAVEQAAGRPPSGGRP